MTRREAGMDGWRRPVGNQPPGVYWVRRIIVLVLAAVVVVALVFLVSSLTGGGDQAEAPESGASASPDATADAAPDPSRACVADDVTLAVAATPDPVPADSTAGFSVTVTDVGTSPCTLSTSAEGTELAVRSGNDEYYSSTWCEDDPGFGDAQWILEPGDTQTIDLTWSGVRYDDTCAQIADRAAGSYWVAVAIAGVPADEVQFQLAG